MRMFGVERPACAANAPEITAASTLEFRAYGSLIQAADGRVARDFAHGFFEQFLSR